MKHRGFSLAELMIAIGIMGVGLIMLSALFPAALKEFAGSDRSIIGSIIGKNGITIARKVLEYPVTDDVLFVDLSDKISEGSRKYPIDEASAQSGWFLLGRRVYPDRDASDAFFDEEFYPGWTNWAGLSADGIARRKKIVLEENKQRGNNFILAVVSYKLWKPKKWELHPGHAELKQLDTIAIAAGETEFQCASVSEEIRAGMSGSHIISPAGEFTTIVNVVDTTAYLKRPFDEHCVKPFVVVGHVWNDDKKAFEIQPYSPSLCVYMTRTSLDESP